VSNDRSAHLFSGDWVLPVAAPPIRDGVVAVEGTRIAWVGERRELPSRFLGAQFRAFPRSVILPGWVNAHCHLNLTAALGVIPGDADHFTAWLRAVIHFQQALPPPLLRQSITAGMDLLASSGTTTVAHLTTLPDLEPFLVHPMRSVVFHEAIGFPAVRAGELLEQAEDWLDGASAILDDAETSRISLGLAPHAPYSTSPALIVALRDLATERGLPLSIHLAETRSETEFLRSGAGEFRGLLEERHAWDPAWAPPELTPIRYVARLGLLSRTGAAVHCNYLSDEDVELLARAQLRPVWCPGSHRYFGHRQHPAARLLAADAELALGTDSMASNRGLDMLREVRLAAEALPDVPQEAWLRAATLGGAEALGLGAVTGSLEAGKAADLQVVTVLNGSSGDEAERQGTETITDPLSALVDGTVRVRMVLVDGAEMKVR
jgi:5-methylthioadenosine/S-adenosylhomocysteine deaminase